MHGRADGLAECRIQLLGSLSIAFDGKEFSAALSGAKIKLLAYLALACGVPQSRKQLAFDFWPDSSERQALSNLRKLLHDLRQTVPPIDRYLEIAPRSIRWIGDPAFYSDVREFERAAQGTTLFEIRRAEQLYGGELLPGYYEEWLSAKRELLAQTYLNVLDKLVAMLENRRDYPAALVYANKLLVQDKLREESYRTLMRLHSLSKDTSSVVRIFRQLKNVLQEELGIEPAQETRELLESFSQTGEDRWASVPDARRLIGRIAEWGRMRSAWKQAALGTNILLILKGEAGIGKTRLAMEFKARVESLGHPSAWADCYPTVRSMSYAPVTAWLRSLPVPSLSPVRLTELARLMPELLERDPDLPKPGAIQENWQLSPWYEAIERMLLDRQPILLVLDDMQWSDGETLKLLSYLLRTDSKARLLVIATMRTEEKPDDAFEQLVSDLAIERKLIEIDLAPLSEEETRGLMAETVGDALANRHASGIHAETGGNPLFIMETLREWQMGGGQGDFRLSQLARSVIENRLSKLTPDHRHLVSALATVGRPVSAALMAMATYREEDEVLERIEHLTKAKILRETEDGEYDFTHDLIREAAYKLIKESGRRQGHAQIARSLAAGDPVQTEAYAAEIAYHYERAGANQDSVSYYEIAASAAEKIYANETRIHCYKKLCKLLPPERMLPALMKLGDALLVVGKWSEAENAYREWLERYGYTATIQERSLCDVALGNCLRHQGRYEEARVRLERALYHLKLAEDQAGLSLVYGTLGSMYYFRADYERALYYLLERMELPDVGNRSRDDCRFFGFIGFLYYDQCEYDRAVHWFERQIKLAAEIRDAYFIGEAMGGLAMVHFETDEMNSAFDRIHEKLEISQSLGARMNYAMAVGMLGKYYHLHGSHEQAERCIAFCLEEAVQIRDWHIASVVLGIEGCILMERGQYEEAGLMMERSIGLAKQNHIPFFECEGLYFLSLLRRRQHRYESAVEAAEEALRIAERLGRRETRVNLLVLLALLKTDLVRIAPVEAAEHLERMLEQYPGPQDQAAIRFALWKLYPDSPGHRTSALMLNEKLYRRSGKERYLLRCREMNSPLQETSARPMPRIAADATLNNKIPRTVLEEIDRYLNRVG